MSLKAKIKAGAIGLGFSDCGFTNVEPVPGFERYRNWLARGQHANMDYLTSERALETRADPRRLLPSCRTVISLIAAYPPPGDLRSEHVHGQETGTIKELETGTKEGSSLRAQRSNLDGRVGDLRSDHVHGQKAGRINGAETGKIAAYALQPDYHDTIRNRLEKLAELISELAGTTVESYACVDSAPILEKGYAHKAGLGWIGRNSLLLHPLYGSWTNLSELLIDLEIEPDPPFEEEGCGQCRLCVRACPTQAIQPDRTVDARRCLSYLTIENRGPIPPEFRGGMGNRVFGCDTCQAVCPVNKRANTVVGENAIEEFPDLAENFLLTEEEFKSKFRCTPVWRAKYSGFRRNLAVAMGNSGDQNFAPILEKALLESPDLVIADAVGWALAQLTA